MTKILTSSDLAHRIMGVPSKHHQRIIAIDGGGGAGKTTFATCLQQAMTNIASAEQHVTF